jgi:ammonia channel protein AmtB
VLLRSSAHEATQRPRLQPLLVAAVACAAVSYSLLSVREAFVFVADTESSFRYAGIARVDTVRPLHLTETISNVATAFGLLFVIVTINLVVAAIMPARNPEAKRTDLRPK